MDYDPSSSSSYPQAGPSNSTPFSSAPLNAIDYSSSQLPAEGSIAYDGIGFSSSTGNHDPDSDYRPLSGPGSRGGRGSGRLRGSGSGRGRGRGSGRGRGRGGGRGSRGGMRASTRISERIASGPNINPSSSSSSKIQSLKLSFKTSGGGGNGNESSGGRMMSFLGEYDRELDENPEDPLAFEEQFILRVPKEIAEGTTGNGKVEGLRELVKGKGKGLDGIEFKFFGKLLEHAS